MSRRSSSSPLEILLGLLGTALVTLAAYIWRVYTAKPEYDDQPYPPTPCMTHLSDRLG